MIQQARVPKELKQVYVAPLDKSGRDPTECANNRPIELLSPLINLRELIAARRMLPIVGNSYRPTHTPSSQQEVQRRFNLTLIFSPAEIGIKEDASI